MSGLENKTKLCHFFASVWSIVELSIKSPWIMGLHLCLLFILGPERTCMMSNIHDMAEPLWALPQGAYIPIGFPFPLTLPQTPSRDTSFLFSQSVIWGQCLQKQDSGIPLLTDFRNQVIRYSIRAHTHVCGGCRWKKATFINFSSKAICWKGIRWLIEQQEPWS